MRNLFIAICTASLLFVLQQAAVAQTAPDKIYWMQTITVPLSKLQSFHAFNAEKALPFLRANGYPVKMVWQTLVGDIEEVMFVAEFDSMDEYNKARQTLFASEEWKEISALLEKFSRETHTRFLAAMPYVN